MDIPKLPTDNLYKFYSIFGLVLFVFGIYLIYNSRIEEYKARQKLIQLAEEYINKAQTMDSIPTDFIPMDSIDVVFQLECRKVFNK